MDLLNNLALGFSTAFSLTNLLYCFIGVTLGTLIWSTPWSWPSGHLGHAFADHLFSRSDGSSHYACRHLLRFSVRRLYHGHPCEPSRRVSLSRNLLRRLSNGKKRQSRHCLRSCRHRLFHCRLFCYCLGRCFRSSVD